MGLGGDRARGAIEPGLSGRQGPRLAPAAEIAHSLWVFADFVDSVRLFGRSKVAAAKLLVSAAILLSLLGGATLLACSIPSTSAPEPAGAMAFIAPGPALVFSQALEHLRAGGAPGSVLVGSAFAAWIFSIPVWVLTFLAFGFLAPGYYALQLDRGEPRSFAPGLRVAVRVGTTHLLSTVATVLMGALGALPGLLTAVLLALSDQPFGAGLSLVGAYVGGLVAHVLARVHLGFAERAAALHGYGPIGALIHSHRLAGGRRGELFKLWALTGTIRLSTAMPWFLLLGWLTHPFGWVVADTLWTYRYVRLTEARGHLLSPELDVRDAPESQIAGSTSQIAGSTSQIAGSTSQIAGSTSPRAA